MTGLLASVSCSIPVIFWEKHHQTSFSSKSVLLISDNHEILAVVCLNLSLDSNKQHRTDLLQITRWWETPTTCSYMQQDSCWVWCTSWLLFIPFWHEPHYIFLRTFHFFSLSSSSPIPHHQIIDTQTPPPVGDGSQADWTMGASSNRSLLGTQRERKHHFIHRDSANEAI